MIPVINITYKDITAIHEDATLRRVVQTMVRHRVSAVPVVDKLGNYMGCISEQDILNAGVPDYMKLLKNTSFMANLNRNVKHLKALLEKPAFEFLDVDYPTVDGNNTISFAADLMFRTRRIVLPVLEGRRLVGLVSRIDILSVAIEKDESSTGGKPC